MSTNSPSALKPSGGSHWFDLHDGEIRIPFRPQPTSDEQTFVVDIYSALANKHPELHLGWWAWPREIATQANEIVFVYRPAHEVAAYLVTPGDKHPAHDQWVNPDYQLTAFQQVSLIWYNNQHVPRKQAVLVMTAQDRNLLQRYYTDHAQWYTAEQPFALAFHRRRLAVLTRLFHQYIRPGDRVLDVGSGHSFFFLTNAGKWPYSIICMDLDQALIKQVAPERARFTWMAGAIQHLPFVDAAFDTVFAGEVIEHVHDGDATLAEWRRVLRPGGRLILSTPNRRRLLNRLNGDTVPVSPEHPIEYTYTELSAMFTQQGFKILHREGIYLELLALWRQRFPYIDPLAGPEPLRRHLRVLELLMAVGRPLPQLAFDMVFVGQKQ